MFLQIHGTFLTRFTYRCDGDTLLKYFLFIFLINSTALAQAPKAKTKTSSLKSYLSKSFLQTNVGLTYWQETIDISNTTSSGQLAAFFEGLDFQATYLKPRQSLRSLYTYTGLLALGGAKGTASGGLSDEFAQQKWLKVGFAPGILYRTGMRTELGIRIPLEYRLTFWEVTAGSNVKIDRSNSFSYGISGVFAARYSLRAAIAATLTYHHVWQTSVWSVSWQYDFR